MSHPAEVHVTLIGSVASGPEFAVCGNGAPRAAFKLAVPERRFDRASALWVTTRISHYTVICWRTLAEHVGSSLGRGDPVLVTGRQRIGEGGGVEVDAAAVGHDLRYGLSSFRAVAQRYGPAADPGGATGPLADPMRPPGADAFAPPPAPPASDAACAPTAASERPSTPTKL
ncbi:MAG TPA: single-stranded DNA-binding protein [Actinocrinis sp.]|nr:single-stranded DNA-binding protein [Actinocrinis sp.]